MKKILGLFVVLLASSSMISCDSWFSIKPSATYYGVAGYIDFGEGNKSALSLNIPGLGWVVVPESDDFSADIDGEVNEFHEIAEGDLVELYFNKASNVEIQESFPAQFGKEPDSIRVYKENVLLEQNEDSDWIFDCNFDEYEIQHDFDISEAAIGTELWVWHVVVVDTIPDHESIFSTSIGSISDGRLSFVVPNEYIEDFLIYFIEDGIIIYNEEIV